MKGLRSKRALLGLVIATSLAAAGVAMADGAGLGSNWPNASDVSSNPQFHAYRWVQGGAVYVQVNQANGAPLIAVATDGKGALVLPIGHPELVEVDAADAGVTGTPVYSDGAVTIQATSSGFSVQPQQLRTAALCKDPIECGGPAATTQAKATTTTATSTNATAAACKDPIECGGPAASVPK